MIDIAVPRDIDPGVADLDSVRLFDIDQLGQVAEVDLDSLDSEIRRATDVIDAEVSRFVEWWNSSDTMELTVSMRRRADVIRQQEIARTLKLLGADTDSELAARLDAMTNALVKKLLHQPTAELRSADSATIFPTALRMFGDAPPNGKRRGRR